MSERPRTPANSLRNPAFLGCAFLLLAAGISAGPAASLFHIQLRKEAVPLRKELTRLDKSALGEYEFLHANTIEAAVLAGLRANEYVDWEFVDTSIKERSSPLYRVRLFVTHNTGQPSMVVHVPDQCWVGNGYSIEELGNSAMELDLGGPKPVEVPLRAVTFSKSEIFQNGNSTVVYTFHCNGKFLSTQQRVNSALLDPRDEGAYFTKMEVTFVPTETHVPSPNREDTIKAAEKFLSRVLPVLLRDHLPDWEQWKASQHASNPDAPVASAGGSGR